MMSQNLRRTADCASKTLRTGQRAYSSFDREFDRISSLMTREFGRGLYRRSSPWDLFGHRPSLFYEPTVYYHQPTHSTFEHKTITRDENGRVVVKTQRKVSGEPWKIYVEEHTNENMLEQNKNPQGVEQISEVDNTKTTESKPADQEQTSKQSSTESKNIDTGSVESSHGIKDQINPTQSSHPTSNTNALRLFDQHFQQLSDSFMRDFDDFFTIRHPFRSTSNWFEPEIDIENTDMIDNSTTYHAETVINNNGRLTRKTVTKKPGSGWETTVKHYGKDGLLEENKQQVEAIAENNKNSKENSQKLEQSADNETKSSSDETARQ